MNQLNAIISNITQSTNLALITLDCVFGKIHTLIVVDESRPWKVGDKVKAIFKQTQVLVCKVDFSKSFKHNETKDSLKSNAPQFSLPTRNYFISKIVEIEREEILTRVECEAGISALIAGIDDNGLEVGQDCAWLIVKWKHLQMKNF